MKFKYRTIRERAIMRKKSTKRPVQTRRRRRVYKKINRPVKLYQPVPNRALVKLNYTSLHSVTINGGAYVQQVFQTSLNDPDLTLGGHQPLWHDQYATLYRKYRVYGIKYDITLANRANTYINNIVWVHLSHLPYSFVTTTSIETEMERSECKHKGLLQNNTGRGGFLRFKGYLNVPKVECLSKRDFGGHEDYEASFGSNPAKVSKLLMGFYTPADDQVRGIVRLKYYAELWDPQSVSTS